MKEITVDAIIENSAEVTGIVDDFLAGSDCPVKTKMQIDIAIDEIFSNISRYAYRDGVGTVTIRVSMQDHPKAACITFIDGGIPYNPLEVKDPDVTLPAEEREAGGLGIYIVKKHMDEMLYEYCDGQNRLQLKKYLEEETCINETNACSTRKSINT